MRYLSCLILGVALLAGSATAQIRVRGGIGIDYRSPRIRTNHVQRHYPQRSCRIVPRRSHRSHRRHHVRRGYWKTICERVWCPPVYEWRRDACGRYYRVCVRQGYYKNVSRRVWVRC